MTVKRFLLYLQNFIKYKYLFNQLVVRDIKLKYRRSFLGIIWSLINPLMMMIVLTIVFSTLFRRNIPNFPVYLLSGKLLFDFFSQSTKASMKSIRSNTGLLKKIYIPKYLFPLSAVFSTYITFLISLIVLILVMIVTNVQININILFGFLPLLYILIFAVGSGLILSTISVFFRDIEHLYEVILLAWMYLTPLFYPAEIVPQKFQILLKINPLYYMITMFREAILYGRMPSIEYNLISILIAIITLIIGLIGFYKKQDHFILYV